MLTFTQYDQALEENGTPMNLVASIETNAKHYLDIMSKAVDNAMPPPSREIKYGRPKGEIEPKLISAVIKTMF
jgi:hypothetical protein